MKSSPAIAIVLLVVSALTLMACHEKPPAPQPKVQELPLAEEAGLFLVGNDQGMIRPCGCSKPVLGGIVRRGAFFAALDEKLRASSSILALGGMIHEGGRQQELKLEAFLESLEDLGVVAILPNENDLLVGSRFWTDLMFQRAEGAAPLAALNLYVDGARLFEPCAVVEIEGRETVVTSFFWPDAGVLSEPGVEARADAPLDELLAALSGGAEPRNLIVYSSAPLPELRAWIESAGLEEKAKDVLALVAGPSDLPILLADEEGFAAFETGRKGRDVVRLDWPDSRAFEHFTLVEAYGEHASSREILDFYRQSVADEQLLLQAPKFEMAEGEYAGPDSCAACHRKAFATWRTSKHADAFATLLETGDDRDPECVRCHVVDYHRQGGFDPVSVTPVNVQCEACHGPSAAHVAEPKLKTPRGKPSDVDCRACHDLANSPYYDWGKYWPEIQHGK